MQGRRILIVDDDADLVSLLVQAFAKEGAAVYAAHDGQAGLKQFFEHQPDLVILDVLMPVMDGWQTFSRIRHFSDVPIIMLTVLGTENDVVRGLDAGAVDYIGKPFSLQVLLARARAALRPRPTSRQREGLRYDDGYLRIDLPQRLVSVRGETVSLSETEFQLLACLVRNVGRLLTKEQILAEVWGEGYLAQTNYVYLYLGRLRKKLEEDPQNPVYLVTVRGAGHRFEPQPRRP